MSFGSLYASELLEFPQNMQLMYIICQGMYVYANWLPRFFNLQPAAEILSKILKAHNHWHIGIYVFLAILDHALHQHLPLLIAKV